MGDLKEIVLGNLKEIMNKYFYTKTEEDEKLKEKADVKHTHSSYVTQSEFESFDFEEKKNKISDIDNADNSNIQYPSAYAVKRSIDSVKSNVDDRLEDLELDIQTKAPLIHDHDDKYLSREVLDNELEGKSDVGHVHDSATQDKAGFLSVKDKIKLDGIEEGANKTIVDGSLSSSSANPVQNKVIFSALGDKSNSVHDHDSLYYTKSEEDVKFNQINSKLDGLIGFKAELVDKLPSVGKEGVIYLIASESSSERNVFDEYLWFNGDFEKIGDTQVEMNYNLPIASKDTLGGVKVGDNLKIDNKGLLSGNYPIYYNIDSQYEGTAGVLDYDEYAFIKYKLDEAWERGTSAEQEIWRINQIEESTNYLWENHINDIDSLQNQISNLRSVDVDDKLSQSSSNPVQNKAIYNSISGKTTISPNAITTDSMYIYEADDINNPLDKKARLYTISFIHVGKYLQIITDYPNGNRIMGRGGKFGADTYLWNVWKEFTVDNSPNLNQLSSALYDLILFKSNYYAENGSVLNVPNANVSSKIIYQHFDWNAGGRPYSGSYRQTYFRYNSYLLGISHRYSSSSELPIRLHYCDSSLDTNSGGIVGTNMKTWDLW